MTDPARSAPLPKRAMRPAELEDFLNRRLYHPLSWRLAQRLLSTRVTPDMVSFAGALAIVLAALAYALLPWAWGVLIGLALHMMWHVLDGADGDLARISGRSSPRGELIDGICDYVGHIVLYVTLGWLAAQQIGGWGWALMWAAGASRVTQAAHYEGARRHYLHIIYGTPWMASTAATSGSSGRRHPLVVYYLWLTGLIVPCGSELSAAARVPENHMALRHALHGRGHAWLARMSLLSANYRTLAVGAAMLAGRPHWYFLFEVLLLNGVLLASLLRVRAVFRAVLAHADELSTRR